MPGARLPARGAGALARHPGAHRQRHRLFRGASRLPVPHVERAVDRRPRLAPGRRHLRPGARRRDAPQADRGRGGGGPDAAGDPHRQDQGRLGGAARALVESACVKFLFDLFPVVLFFVAFKIAGIYIATAVAIAATFAQVAWLKLKKRKIEPMLWASLAIIVVFGGATLFLQDETFIKWKPTVLYWLFAAVLGGAAAARRNLIRTMLSQ